MQLTKVEGRMFGVGNINWPSAATEDNKILSVYQQFLDDFERDGSRNIGLIAVTTWHGWQPESICM